MLRKMYLVSADKYHKPSQQPAPSYGKTNKKKSKKPLVTNTRQNKKQHPIDKWVKFRERIHETNVQREAIIKQIAELLRKVLPTDTLHQRVSPKRDRSPSLKGTQTPQQVEKDTVLVLPSPSSTGDNVYVETPKKTVVEIEDDDNGEGEGDVEESLKSFGRKHYGELASPFLGPYLSNTRMLDTQYGIRRDGDNFKIGNSNVTVDNMSNITLKGKQFKGTEDLWKLLTRKNIDYDSIDKNELQKYKTILEMTNAHLEGYKAGSNIQTSRGIKFRNVIAKLFPEAKVATRQKWVTY